MDVLEAIYTRRSIRKYKDVPIPRSVMADILMAGQHAPSAGNLQNCRYIIIDDEDLKDKIAEASYSQTWMKTAPVYIVIAADVSKIEKFYPGRGANFYSLHNAAAIAENMIMAATNHGLGSCWVGDFNERIVRELLHIPEDYVPQIIVTFGYPNEKVPKPAKLGMNVLVYLNGFGGQYRSMDRDWVFNEFAKSLHTSAGKGFKSIGKSLKEIKDSFKKQ
jgi:nitroreductase